MADITFLEKTPGGSLQEVVDGLLKDFRNQNIECVAIVWRRGVRPDEKISDYRYVKEHFVWSKNSVLEIQGLLQDMNYEISVSQRKESN